MDIKHKPTPIEQLTPLEQEWGRRLLAYNSEPCLEADALLSLADAPDIEALSEADSRSMEHVLTCKSCRAILRELREQEAFSVPLTQNGGVLASWYAKLRTLGRQDATALSAGEPTNPATGMWDDGQAQAERGRANRPLQGGFRWALPALGGAMACGLLMLAVQNSTARHNSAQKQEMEHQLADTRKQLNGAEQARIVSAEQAEKSEAARRNEAEKWQRQLNATRTITGKEIDRLNIEVKRAHQTVAMLNSHAPQRGFLSVEDMAQRDQLTRRLFASENVSRDSQEAAPRSMLTPQNPVVADSLFDSATGDDQPTFRWKQRSELTNIKLFLKMEGDDNWSPYEVKGEAWKPSGDLRLKRGKRYSWHLEGYMGADKKQTKEAIFYVLSEEQAAQVRRRAEALQQDSIERGSLYWNFWLLDDAEHTFQAAAGNARLSSQQRDQAMAQLHALEKSRTSVFSP